ncbi:MAG: agmatine deiminase family protein [Paludibacteraceae bacterium]|nr:agmatine deiminase family protein [Paludibacteraceae bacterium]
MDLFLPAEWSEQCGVQLTWPHKNSDWAPLLDEVRSCFIEIARQIVKREKLLIVCHSEEEVRDDLKGISTERILFREIPSNDTWARDHGPITVFKSGIACLCDFRFNGWGMKFAANWDNQITSALFASSIFDNGVEYCGILPFVLEGGSIESDGKGTILTTRECLMSLNRNEHLSQKEIEEYLSLTLGAKRFLWLNHGYLAGDDTDSHVDTLARFCDERTIAYVQCLDQSDEHYDALRKMEEELLSFKTIDGNPYRLIPLPMAEACYDGEDRLPATYANFLIMNDAVLVPIYNCSTDDLALRQLASAFPSREIVGIDCRVLIKQHGSLHCVTMQYPQGVF